VKGLGISAKKQKQCSEIAKNQKSSHLNGKEDLTPKQVDTTRGNENGAKSTVPLG
jgi:hypothetical protein